MGDVVNGISSVVVYPCSKREQLLVLNFRCGWHVNPMLNSKKTYMKTNAALSDSYTESILCRVNKEAFIPIALHPTLCQLLAGKSYLITL